MPDDADQADSTPTNEPNPKPVEGEGEGQSTRFEPDSHWHRPDTSDEDPPKEPSGEGLDEVLLEVFNPDWTESKTDAIAARMEADAISRAMEELEAEEGAAGEAEERAEVVRAAWLKGEAEEREALEAEAPLIYVTVPGDHHAEPVRGRKGVIVVGGFAVAVGVIAAGLLWFSAGDDSSDAPLDGDAAAPSIVVEDPSESGAAPGAAAPAQPAPEPVTGPGSGGAEAPAPTGAPEVNRSTDTAAPLTTTPEATMTGIGYERRNPHIVTVIVAGDGRAFSSATNTTYYNVLLVIETPDGVFTSRASMRGGTLEWEVAGPNTLPIEGATLAAEWTEATKYVMTITNPDNDAPATAIQVDVLVGVVDSKGNDVYYQHGLLWTL